jgi:hypothetical protein
VLRSFVSTSLVLILFSGAVSANEQEGPHLSTQAPKPPIATKPSSDSERALVLPTRARVGGTIEGPAVDVLLTTGLQNLGVTVVNRREKSSQCDARFVDLEKAKRQYLDMDLAGAFEMASMVREEQLARHADLLGCRELTEVELFMVQVLLDMKRADEARKLSVQILNRNPKLRLDPARFTPVAQAFWAEMIRSQKGLKPAEPDYERLSEIGRSTGVEWVVMGNCAGSTEDGEQVVVLIVPTEKDKQVTRHLMVFDAPSEWSATVREVLEEQFPKPVPDKVTLVSNMSPMPAQQSMATEMGDVKSGNPWYKTWWFWTAVGVVVVGGTAGAVGGYYGSQDDNATEVGMDPW